MCKLMWDVNNRSRVNSSLCLDKSRCSQTLKVGGVLIYKWVEHVPDTWIKWPFASKRIVL